MPFGSSEHSDQLLLLCSTMPKQNLSSAFLTFLSKVVSEYSPAIPSSSSPLLLCIFNVHGIVFFLYLSSSLFPAVKILMQPIQLSSFVWISKFLQPLCKVSVLKPSITKYLSPSKNFPRRRRKHAAITAYS